MARLYLIGLILILTHCSTHPKIETYLSNVPTPEVSFVKAKLDVTIESGSENETVSAVALCVPDKKYRLELYGPLGIHIGSFLWIDNIWELFIPEQQTVIKGTGPHITLLNIENINIHLLAGVIWGKLLPDGWNNAKHIPNSDKKTIQWSDSTTTYHATVNYNNGEVESLRIESPEGISSITYTSYAVFSSHILPSTSTHTLADGTVVTIELTDIDYTRTEKNKYWVLKRPETTKIIYAN